MMPALLPGGTLFFDPALDPVWAACVDVGLPVSQHGGTGAPAYGPPGCAAIMTLALEQSFFSGRSLWQMILGGVFERFPGLRVAFIETEAVGSLRSFASSTADSTGATTGRGGQPSRRMRQFRGSARTTGRQLPRPHLSLHRGPGPSRPAGTAECRLRGFRRRLGQRDVGVDYAHFESVFPETKVRWTGWCSIRHLRRGVAEDLLRERRCPLGFGLAGLASDVERVGFDIDGEAAPDRAPKQSRRVRQASSPSQHADGLTVRAKSARSTAIRPNVLEKPAFHSKLSSSVQWQVAAHVDTVRQALGQALDAARV